MSTTAIERPLCAHCARDASTRIVLRLAAGVTGFGAACRTVYQRAPP